MVNYLPSAHPGDSPIYQLWRPRVQEAQICCLDRSRRPLPQCPVPSRQASFVPGTRCHVWLLLLSLAGGPTVGRGWQISSPGLIQTSPPS